MSSAAENDAEDVNDFLKRIHEMGVRRDQEDEERNRKLEDEILQGRKERQARRAERAKSISRIKDNDLPAHSASALDSPDQDPSSAAPPELRPPPSPRAEAASQQSALDDTMGRLTGEHSPLKENRPDSWQHSPAKENNPDSWQHSPLKENTRPDSWQQLKENTRPDSWQHSPLKETLKERRPDSWHPSENTPRRTDPPTASPSSAMPSRAPLPWQRRPASSDRPRPLSMIATRNVPRPSEAMDTTPPARDTSPSYRRVQAEAETAETPSRTPQLQLPSISRPASSDNRDIRNEDWKVKDLRRPVSSSGSSSPRTGFPMPNSSAQLLSHPESTNSSDGNQAHAFRSLAMSPSQGRISPERREKSVSPTKGMGGFVQSAMMKRSDSVSKRWSVKSSIGLNRGNSTVGNQSSQDLASAISMGNAYSPSTLEPGSASLSRESTPSASSRPSSSRSNITTVPEAEPADTNYRRIRAQSIRDDTLMKPGLPALKPTPSLETPSRKPNDLLASPAHSDASSVPSPSRTGADSRRWSPTKSSWLESALKKPDSPKPKQAAPQQPSWMVEISKAKQKANSESPTHQAHKHQNSFGGLLRPPPIESPAGRTSREELAGDSPSGTVRDASPKRESLNGSDTAFIAPSSDEGLTSPRKKSLTDADTTPTASNSDEDSKKPTSTSDEDFKKPTISASDEDLKKPTISTSDEDSKKPNPTSNTARPITHRSTVTSVSGSPFAVGKDSPVILTSDENSSDSTKATDNQARPIGHRASVSTTTGLAPLAAKNNNQTPPRDFRANLKPRPVPSDNDGKEEPEFKNVFGQLRHTKTKNYVAPDKLKENILRGKAGLNATGGPKKAERKDELKEAILQKKEEFRKAQFVETNANKAAKAQEVQLPEALLIRESLGRSNSVAARSPDRSPERSPGRSPERSPMRSPERSPMSSTERSPERSPERSLDPKSATQDAADLPFKNSPSSTTPKPRPLSEANTPGKLQITPASKLAERVNPALAGLFARRPSSASASPTKSAPSSPERRASGETAEAQQEARPQLTHMTKGRARGPRRKAPSTIANV